MGRSGLPTSTPRPFLKQRGQVSAADLRRGGSSRETWVGLREELPMKNCPTMGGIPSGRREPPGPWGEAATPLSFSTFWAINVLASTKEVAPRMWVSPNSGLGWAQTRPGRGDWLPCACDVRERGTELLCRLAMMEPGVPHPDEAPPAASLVSWMLLCLHCSSLAASSGPRLWHPSQRGDSGLLEGLGAPRSAPWRAG